MLFSECCQNKSLSIAELTDFLAGGLPLAAAEPVLTQGFKSKSSIYWFTGWFALSVGGKWENWIALEVTSCADPSLPCICQGSALALRVDWGITNIQFTPASKKKKFDQGLNPSYLDQHSEQNSLRSQVISSVPSCTSHSPRQSPDCRSAHGDVPSTSRSSSCFRAETQQFSHTEKARRNSAATLRSKGVGAHPADLCEVEMSMSFPLACVSFQRLLTHSGQRYPLIKHSLW